MIKKFFTPVFLAIMIIFTSQFGTVALAAETTPKQGILETSASSELEVAPDIAYIYVNITIVNESKDKSFNTNKASVNNLVNSLIEAKIPKSDIVTTGFFSNPYIDRILEDPKAAYPVYREVKKYQTTTNLKITVRNISNVGDIIEKMLSVEDVNISNVSYTVSNITSYKKEAIQGAVNAARENLSFAAEASDVKLDKLQSLTVDFHNNTYQPYPIYAKTMDAGSSSPLYQNPGNIKISASVRMVYSVK
jgi:uncharacterized protein